MEDAANHGLYEKRQAEAFAKGDHAKAKSRESLLGQAEVLQDAGRVPGIPPRYLGGYEPSWLCEPSQ